MSTTKNHVSVLKEKIRTLNHELAKLDYELKLAQNTCKHQWGKTTYEPIVKEGYTIPGDTPGTHGIDWRGPTHVPREETARWKRTCSICETTEFTNQVTEQVTKMPTFRTT